jgi:hypothetical protein
LQALRTGSLAKGLMAGLGAYGGAGLMGAVTGAGAGAASGMAGAEAAGAGAAEATAQMAPSVGNITPSVYDFNVGPQVGDLQTIFDSAQSQNALLTPSEGQLFGGPGVSPAATAVAPPPTTVTNSPFIAKPGTMLAPRTVPYENMKAMGLSDDVIRQSATEYGSNVAGTAQAPFSAATQKALTSPVSTGFGEVFKDPSKVLTKDNLKYGLAALSPALFQEEKSAQAPVDREQMRFAFDSGRLTPPTRMGDVGEYTYFRPSYTRLAAEGGTMTSDYTYDPETQLYSREKTPPQQDRASSGNAGPYTMGAPDPTPNGFQDLTSAQKQDFFEQNPNMAAVTRGGQTLMGLTSLGMLSNALNPVANAQHAFDATPNAQANMHATNIGMDLGQIDAGGGGGNVDSGGGGGMSNAGEGGGGPGSPGWAKGGISHLGDYSDGGRLLRGPGDGVSDSIPATIANKRPARLADGEFVVPARIVSELGNGSTEAGARKLYAMMDRIQKNRTKSVGKDKVAVNSRSEQLLPA